MLTINLFCHFYFFYVNAKAIVIFMCFYCLKFCENKTDYGLFISETNDENEWVMIENEKFHLFFFFSNWNDFHIDKLILYVYPSERLSIYLYG